MSTAWDYRIFPKLCVQPIFQVKSAKDTFRSKHPAGLDQITTPRELQAWYLLRWYMLLCDTSSAILYSVIYLSCNVSGNGLAVQKVWQYCCRQHQSSNPPNGSSDGGGSTSLLNALLLVWYLNWFIFNLEIGNCSFHVALKAQRKIFHRMPESIFDR